MVKAGVNIAKVGAEKAKDTVTSNEAKEMVKAGINIAKAGAEKAKNAVTSR